MHELDIAKLKAGDEDALRSFYAFIVPKIRRTVTHILNDRVEVEDVVEEITSRILSNSNVVLRFEEPSKIEAYCVRIARNIAVESRRRFEKEDRSVGIAESYFQQNTAVVKNPEEIAATAEIIEKVLSELTDLERQIITLRFFHELSYHEIAERLGISAGSVTSMFSRSLAKMRRYLE